MNRLYDSIRFSLFVMMMLLAYYSSNATHLVGADITYTSLGGNLYKVELTFYRDCQGSLAPSGVGINFVSENCHKQFTDTLYKEAGSGTEITYPCPGLTTSCISSSSTVPGIQEFKYSKLITFPARCNDWVISWSYCCRNCDITTLNTPQPCSSGSNPGMYVTATLNNLDYDHNTSSHFTNVPITFVCIGQDFIFNHGVVDPDGDSLVYELVDPLRAKNTPVPYMPGYSATNPITSNPPLAINSETGDISMSPLQPEVGVLSVRISEYRNGILVGTVVRDMAIYAKVCNNNLPELSGMNGTSVHDTTVCPGANLCFDIYSVDNDLSQNLTMNWNQAIQGAAFQQSGTSRPVGTFCWTPAAVDVRSAPYTFTVMIMDDACPSKGYQTVSYSIRVAEPEFDIATIDVACSGIDNGIATVTTSCAGCTYEWSNGSSGMSSLTGLSAGTYSVLINDSLRGCSASRYFTIAAAPDPIVLTTDSVRQLRCFGDQDGFIAVSAQAGAGNYSYSWYAAANPGIELSNDMAVNDLQVGDYIVSVTDGNGCVTSNTIQIQSPTVLQLVTSSTPATCGSSDGFADVVVSGGSPGYTYDWGSGISSTSVRANCAAGLYTVSVFDGNGCRQDAQVTVSNINLPVPTILALGNVTCPGAANGKAFVLPQGGTAPFTYSWTTVPPATTDTVYGLAPGTYTAGITDANGCQSFNTVTITEPLPIDFTPSATDPTCNGSGGGSLIVSAISGGTSPYTYDVLNADGQSVSMSDMEAGSYQVIITDANGCNYTRQVQLNDPPRVSITLNALRLPTCFGGSDGYIQVTSYGGTGSLTYMWENGVVGQDYLVGLSSGTYNLTVIDDNGCEATTSISLRDPKPVDVHAGSDSVLCEGTTVQLAATLEHGQTGSWSSTDQEISYSDLQDPDATVSQLSPGDNTLIWTVTDENGCTGSAQVHIRNYNSVDAIAGTDTSVCGSSAILLHASQGADGMIGMWTSSNGSVFSDPADPNAIVNIIHRGTDTLRWVLSAEGCSKSGFMLVRSRECGFELPTGFSPNGDGKNDGYVIKGLDAYPYNVIRIYNRWGNEVFSRRNYSNGEWSGQNQSGDRLPEGTYFVIFETAGTDFHACSYIELRR